LKGSDLEAYRIKNVIYSPAPKSFDIKDFIKKNLISLENLQDLLQCTVVQMLEAQSKLYLHVYDVAGNHVGFNFAQNTTDVNIPSSSYFDNQHGKIEIVLPPDLKDFRIVVDGTHAHYNHENYTLRIYRFGSENHTTSRCEGQEIEKGTSRNYLVTVLNNDEIVVNEILRLSVSISPLSASILVGQTVTFTSTVSGGFAPYTYQWYLNDNPVSGATSNTWTFTPTTSGIYYVHLKVTDDEGNSAQSGVARITATTVPVGGYSVPIQTYTKTASVIPYIALTAILTLVFTTVKRKTTKKTRRSP
jgi:energy-converting hydrogenase Eha subunit E